jgi:DNA-binding Xre family transcriptional regulator
MLSTYLEYLCTELECFPEGWNALDRVGIPWYRVGMFSAGLECFLQGWNASCRVAMISTLLEYICTELECFLEGWNAFDRVGIPLYTVGMLSTVFV